MNLQSNLDQILASLLVTSTPIYPTDRHVGVPHFKNPMSKGVPHLLAKRANIGTIYHDNLGGIRAIFNLNVDYAVLHAFQVAGVAIEANVMAEARRFLIAHVPMSQFSLNDARFYAQVGQHWQNVIQGPGGVGTVSFTITLAAFSRSFCLMVVHLLEDWFSQGGNTAALVQVQDVSSIGIAFPDNLRRDTVSGRKEERDEANKYGSCPVTFQNMPFVFTGGEHDLLAARRITC